MRKIVYNSSTTLGGRKMGKFIAGFGLMGCLVWIAFLIGWIINICKFCGCDFSHFNPELVVRGVGIIMVPLGGVMGFVPHSWFM
jgi:hypothetical protein